MENELISVIIPVYNVEPYLCKCLDSVISQTYKNLEIILIDDGSTDGSGKICDVYQKEDKRVIVIHKENNGQAAARNDGLDIARGEWIAFLDSDDWVEPEMYQKLLYTAKSNHAELSSCLTRYCHIDSIPKASGNGNVIILKGTEIVKGLFQNSVRFEVWDKLWKRTLIGDTRFVRGQISEEIYFDRINFLKANKIACLQLTLHNYLLSRPGNTLSSFRQGRLCVFDEINKLADAMTIKGAIDIAMMARCWCMDFAISMYIEAKTFDQDTWILRQIKDSFKRNYKLTSNKCEGRPKKKQFFASLFNINGELCYLYALCKRKIKSKVLLNEKI